MHRLDPRHVLGRNDEGSALPLVGDRAKPVDHTLAHHDVDPRRPRLLFAHSARILSRISTSLPGTASLTARATVASACKRFALLTMPISLPPSTTGKRLMRWRSIRST